MTKRVSRREFLEMAAIATSSVALPNTSFAAPAQEPAKSALHQGERPVGREKVSLKVRSFPLKQVRLGDGPCKDAMEADRHFLRSLPPDRLLHTFRINAGILSTAEPLGGWEAPDCEVRGHYAGGHYL